MISRLSQEQFKNQEKFDFKIQEKMNSRLKRRNQEDFTREVLKRFFKKQTAQFFFQKKFSQNFLSYQSFYSLVIDYQIPVIDYKWQSLFSKAFN